MSGPKHRLYLDESGDHTSSDQNDIGKRFLGVTGVVLVSGEALAFRDALDALKRQHLPYDPDDPPILHRVAIKQATGPFRVLLDPDKRRAFDEDLIELIKDTNFYAVAVVIDKVEHGKKKYRRLSHPYHYCLLAMLERYCGRLNRFSGVGDVMAESRGGREDMALKEAYNHIYKFGGYYLGTTVIARTLIESCIR